MILLSTPPPWCATKHECNLHQLQVLLHYKGGLGGGAKQLDCLVAALRRDRLHVRERESERAIPPQQFKAKTANGTSVVVLERKSRD